MREMQSRISRIVPFSSKFFHVTVFVAIGKCAEAKKSRKRQTFRQQFWA
jgi:hypothetical protein